MNYSLLELATPQGLRNIVKNNIEKDINYAQDKLIISNDSSEINFFKDFIRNCQNMRELFLKLAEEKENKLPENAIVIED